MKKTSAVAALSAACLFVNGAETPPCTLDIKSQEVFDSQWTSVDANRDGGDYQFFYGGEFALYVQNKGKTADDWIISPAVSLKAGRTYRVTASVRNLSPSTYDRQSFTVTAGMTPDVSGMTQAVFSETALETSKKPVERDGVFTPASSGDYHIALHLTSKPGSGDFGFYSFTITDETTAPEAVKDLAIHAATDGSLKATLSWTNPGQTSDGNDADAADRIEILRDGTPVETLTGIKGGTQGLFEDILPRPGSYTYSITAFRGDMASETTMVQSPWIGHDTPEAPTGVAATVEDGTRTVTFEPVTQGVHGGYIDVDGISYTVSRNGVVLTTGLKGAPFTDTEPGLPFAVYRYSVWAVNGESAGDAAESDGIAFGDALPLPFSSDFSSADGFAPWTLADAEGNESGAWECNAEGGCISAGPAASGAWAFTPPLMMQRGECELDVQALCLTYGNPGSLGVFLCRDALSPLSESATEITTMQPDDADTSTTRSFSFTVPETGKYHIGFGATGDIPGWSLFRADVKQTRAGDANVGIDPIREETSLRYVRESEAIVSGRQGTIEVRSADGLLKTVSVTDGAVSVAGLPTGIYVATFTADDGTSSTLKFLKQ